MYKTTGAVYNAPIKSTKESNMFCKVVYPVMTAGLLYLTVQCGNAFFELQDNPPPPERAKLVECYDWYDDYGDLTYSCDFFRYSENEYVTRNYQRQAWNQMKAGIGTDYLLDFNSGKKGFFGSMGILLGLLSVIGVCATVAEYRKTKYSSWS